MNTINYLLFIIIILLNIIIDINCLYPSSLLDITSPNKGIRFAYNTFINIGRCDVNGDGYEDILLSQIVTSSVSNDKIYVVFGPLSRYGQDLYELDLNSLTSSGENGFQIIINHYKRVMCSDLNNDTIDDIYIRLREPNSGRGGVAVIYGYSSINNYQHINGLSDINGINGFIIEGESNTLQSLGSSSTFCDINGDGIKDLVAGTLPGNYLSNDSIPSGNPYIYILYGINGGQYPTDSNGIYDRNLIINGNSGFYIENKLSLLLNCLDLNSDGIDDLAISSQSSLGIIVYGKKSPILFSSPYTISTDGEEGISISPVNYAASDGYKYFESGDFNGDGIKDSIFLVSKTISDGGRSWIVYIVYGSPSNKFGSTLNLDEYCNGIRGKRFMSGTTTSGNDYMCTTLVVSDVDDDGIDDILCFAAQLRYIWGIYGSLFNQYDGSNDTHIFTNDSPTLNTCTGFQVSEVRSYAFETINFKNQTGTKDLVALRSASTPPSYTYVAYYGNQVREFSSFNIINSELNINQTNYNQSTPNEYGIPFLLNNYNEQIEICEIRSIKVSIIDPSIGDSLVLNNIYPLDYTISTPSNYEIIISNINKSTQNRLLDLASSILFYKDNSIINSNSTTNIQLSFINNNRKENIIINILRTQPDSSNSGSISSNDDSSSSNDDDSSSSSNNSNSSSNDSSNSNDIDDSDNDSSSNVGVIVGSVIGGIAGLAIIISIILFIYKRKKKENKNDNDIQLKPQSSLAQLFTGGKIQHIDKF